MAKNPTHLIATADKLFKRILRAALLEQGHDLTGALAESIETKSERVGDAIFIMAFMNFYGKILDEGVSADKIDWKMYPHVIQYFVKRGLNIENAKKAAAATIVKWQQEGMPTKDSSRFSDTGKRKGFIKAAFDKEDSVINSELSNAIEYIVNPIFLKIKSETI